MLVPCSVVCLECLLCVLKVCVCIAGHLLPELLWHCITDTVLSVDYRLIQTAYHCVLQQICACSEDVWPCYCCIVESLIEDMYNGS